MKCKNLKTYKEYKCIYIDITYNSINNGDQDKNLEHIEEFTGVKPEYEITVMGHTLAMDYDKFNYEYHDFSDIKEDGLPYRLMRKFYIIKDENNKFAFMSDRHFSDIFKIIR